MHERSIMEVKYSCDMVDSSSDSNAIQVLLDMNTTFSTHIPHSCFATDAVFCMSHVIPKSLEDCCCKVRNVGNTLLAVTGRKI
jgi:hypothetical protein